MESREPKKIWSRFWGNFDELVVEELGLSNEYQIWGYSLKESARLERIWRAVVSEQE